MLISLNWIRDFVDLPADLDPRALAERLTRTTAEVEEVREIRVDAQGLIAARIVKIENIPDTRNLRRVALDIGKRKPIQTVSAAPLLHLDTGVVYAPPGAHVKALGEITATKVAGQASAGMILPGEAIGIELAIAEAIFLDDALKPGAPLDAGPFDDWVIEIDNKSLTHRPDLWGHYGIAREIAAIYHLPLRPYPVADLEGHTGDLPVIPIEIADPQACPRYTGIKLEQVPTIPAPLWMQLRLGHVGMRPLSGLVDLTNYVMAELGQPMHAFSAEKVDRIEVAFADKGETFRTLDGVDRVAADSTLMIKCKGRSIALAGIMGGLDTEVSQGTTSLLLESANFKPTVIRKAAIALGLRTDASARFEKGLDPAHTVLGIERFIELARSMYPNMRLASALSDAFPAPPAPVTVKVNPKHVDRTIGRKVPVDEIVGILEPLGFHLSADLSGITVRVPSFRATQDVTIEEDVIEEIARYIGYDRIEAALPRITVRQFEPNALHEIENATLRLFTTARRFVEIHGYLWYDRDFNRQIGYQPADCLELVNPAADGLERMRQSMMPNLLAAVETNRFRFSAFSLIELGSIFRLGKGGDTEHHEHRHAGLVQAARGKNQELRLLTNLKNAIESWAYQLSGRQARFVDAQACPTHPWEQAGCVADIVVGERSIGRVGIVSPSLREAIDEHLRAWTIAWAEIRICGFLKVEKKTERLGTIPPHPRVELDFSILVPKDTHYDRAVAELSRLEHPLLKTLAYLASYEGKSVGADHRSLTFRTVIGDETRTLTEEDAAGFREAFEKHVRSCGFEIPK